MLQGSVCVIPALDQTFRDPFLRLKTADSLNGNGICSGKARKASSLKALLFPADSGLVVAGIEVFS